jgi:hypothetical protein
MDRSNQLAQPPILCNSRVRLRATDNQRNQKAEMLKSEGEA